VSGGPASIAAHWPRGALFITTRVMELADILAGEGSV
jgi:hypothetical protein